MRVRYRKQETPWNATQCLRSLLSSGKDLCRQAGFILASAIDGSATSRLWCSARAAWGLDTPGGFARRLRRHARTASKPIAGVNAHTRRRMPCLSA